MLSTVEQFAHCHSLAERVNGFWVTLNPKPLGLEMWAWWGLGVWGPEFRVLECSRFHSFGGARALKCFLGFRFSVGGVFIHGSGVKSFCLGVCRLAPMGVIHRKLNFED